MGIIECLTKVINKDEMKYRYFYKLIKSTLIIELNGVETEIQSYGIEIERQDYRGNILLNVESDKINHVSPQRYKCYEFLKMLYSKEVSPVHLIDILEEHLEDLVKEYDNSYNKLAIN